jgi:hypothetical protein
MTLQLWAVKVMQPQAVMLVLNLPLKLVPKPVPLQRLLLVLQRAILRWLAVILLLPLVPIRVAILRWLAVILLPKVKILLVTATKL